MAKIYHAPITTKDRSSDVWTRWLKSVGDSLVQQTTSTNMKDNNKIKYVINGINCTLVYHDPDALDIADQIITLPYRSLLAFEFNGTVYEAGTTQITIPAKMSYFTLNYTINLQPAQ